MVRLRDKWGNLNIRASLLFQFLYGSIERQPNCRCCQDYTPFQFLYGSIESDIGYTYGAVIPNFNSYMVRLRAVIKGLVPSPSFNFNSYMVRLRGFRTVIFKGWEAHFNSYIVRLRESYRKKQKQTFIYF